MKILLLVVISIQLCNCIAKIDEILLMYSLLFGNFEDRLPKYHPNGTICYEDQLPDDCYFFENLKLLLTEKRCHEVEQTCLGLKH